MSESETETDADAQSETVAESESESETESAADTASDSETVSRIHGRIRSNDPPPTGRRAASRRIAKREPGRARGGAP